MNVTLVQQMCNMHVSYYMRDFSHWDFITSVVLIMLVPIYYLVFSKVILQKPFKHLRMFSLVRQIKCSRHESCEFNYLLVNCNEKYL